MVATYTELIDRLRTWLNTKYADKFPMPNGQPPVSKGIQWIDLYMGQPEALKLRETHNQYPIPLPAIFIQMQVNDWNTRVGHAQDGTMNITFHIVQETLADTYFNVHQNVASINQTEGLRLLLFKSQVHKTLQGFKSSEMQTDLKRISSQLDYSANNVHIDVETYQCQICDDTAYVYKNWIEVMAGLKLTYGMGELLTFNRETLTLNGESLTLNSINNL